MKTKILLTIKEIKLHGKPPSFFAIFVALAYCEPHSPPKYTKIFFEKKFHLFQNSAGLTKSGWRYRAEVGTVINNFTADYNYCQINVSPLSKVYTSVFPGFCDIFFDNNFDKLLEKIIHICSDFVWPFNILVMHTKIQ